MANIIPIININHFSSPDALAVELLKAGRNPGFFYLTGHKLTDDAAGFLFRLGRHFFVDTPTEEKQKFGMISDILGYNGLGNENLSGNVHGDLKESFYLTSSSGIQGQSLPEVLNTESEQIIAFLSGCEKLAITLLEAFAIGLNLPADYFSKRHSGEASRMRINYYPAIPVLDDHDCCDSIRAGAHSDYGSITLLFREPSDQGGLQILVDDKWIDAPCVKDAIIVNIGDALEFWTSGRLRSTVHRVVYPRSESENIGRLSIPFFVQPDADVILAPISQGENDEAQTNFQEVIRRKGYSSNMPITAGQHLQQRIEATFESE